MAGVDASHRVARLVQHLHLQHELFRRRRFAHRGRELGVGRQDEQPVGQVKAVVEVDGVAHADDDQRDAVIAGRVRDGLGVGCARPRPLVDDRAAVDGEDVIVERVGRAGQRLDLDVDDRHGGVYLEVACAPGLQRGRAEDALVRGQRAGDGQLDRVIGARGHRLLVHIVVLLQPRGRGFGDVLLGIVGDGEILEHGGEGARRAERAKEVVERADAVLGVVGRRVDLVLQPVVDQGIDAIGRFGGGGPELLGDVGPKQRSVIRRIQQPLFRETEIALHLAHIVFLDCIVPRRALGLVEDANLVFAGARLAFDQPGVVGVHHRAVAPLEGMEVFMPHDEDFICVGAARGRIRVIVRVARHVGRGDQHPIAAHTPVVAWVEVDGERFGVVVEGEVLEA